MNKLIYILLFVPVFCFGQFNDNRSDISYNWQKLLTFDGASNNDSIGKFYACYSYDTIGNITFSLDSASNAYGITASTGMLYVADNTYLTWGYDTIKVQVCDDGASCGIYYGFIRVKDEDSCVFVDPDWSGTESGTLSEPYNAWSDIVSFTPSYCYMQKRGTSTSSHVVLNAIIATASSPTLVGAYSTGTIPIITEVSSAGGVYFGSFSGTGCQYVEVYDFYFYNNDPYSGVYIDATSDAYSIEVWGCKAHGCGNNAGFYTRGDYEDDVRDLSYGFYNCESSNNGTNIHGFKVNRSVDVINCYSHDNDNSGISCAIGTLDTVMYCYSHSNVASGIELQGDSILVEKNVVYNNGLGGINMDAEAYWEDCIIRSNIVFGQRDQGIGLYDAINILVENNNIYENGQGGNYFARWGINIQGSIDCVIRYNSIRDNVDGGIRVRNGYGASTYSSGDSVYYNWISESPAKAIAMFNGNGGNLYFLNNTIYLDSIYESSSNYNVVAYGNIVEYIDYDVGSNNLLMNSDTIFTDASNYDFTLKKNAINAIDQGYDWGQTRDFTGIRMDDTPDIGAFEFEKKRRYPYWKGTKKKIFYKGVEKKLYWTK